MILARWNSEAALDVSADRVHDVLGHGIVRREPEANWNSLTSSRTLRTIKFDKNESMLSDMAYNTRQGIVYT